MLISPPVKLSVPKGEQKRYIALMWSLAAMAVAKSKLYGHTYLMRYQRTLSLHWRHMRSIESLPGLQLQAYSLCKRFVLARVTLNLGQISNEVLCSLSLGQRQTGKRAFAHRR